MGDMNSGMTAVLVDPQRQGAERLTTMLDELERRVEDFRAKALDLDKEKESILEALNNLEESEALQQLNQCEREEIQVNAERLVCRCLTVDICLTVPRNDAQEEALRSVNRHMETVLHSNNQQSLDALISACSPEPTMTGVPADQKFQAMLLGCTAEDQKNIRKKLKELQRRSRIESSS